jgi:ABC-type transport system involved in multi-copper enzyme maturation permease subunit
MEDMLITIIKKELQGNLSSLRFGLTFLLVIGVFIISGLAFVGKYREELADYREVANRNLEGLQNQTTNLNLIPYYSQTVKKMPRVAQLFAEGHEKSLPNTFRFDVFGFQYPELESKSNFLFPRYADIDWAFIIAFILSFVAIMMTFDSFSGEKERGTLGLMMSNSVPRDKVILGKFFSGMLTLMIPLCFGIFLNLIIVNLLGISFFKEGNGAKILIFFVLSLVYLSLFVLLGLLVSCLAKKSSTSIVVLLFFWVVFTLVIPAFGRIAAEKLVAAPTRADVDRQYAEAHEAIWSDTSKFGRNAGNWGGTNVNPPARAALFNAITETRNRLRENYMNQIVAQVERGRNITRLSPAAIYQFASETIVGTGLERFKNLYRQLRRYKEALKNFLIEKDKDDPESLHLLAEWIGHRSMFSSKPLDFNAIPKFEEEDIRAGEGLKNAVMDIGTLAALNLFLCFAVYMAFLRADVRQQ